MGELIIGDEIKGKGFPVTFPDGHDAIVSPGFANSRISDFVIKYRAGGTATVSDLGTARMDFTSKGHPVPSSTQVAGHAKSLLDNPDFLKKVSAFPPFKDDPARTTELYKAAGELSRKLSREISGDSQEPALRVPALGVDPK